MRVVVLVKAIVVSERGFFPTGWPTDMLQALGRFNDELRRAGTLLGAEGLKPSVQRKPIAFDGLGRRVIDSPFPETGQLVAGDWLWQVRDVHKVFASARR